MTVPLLKAGHVHSPCYWPKDRPPWKPEPGTCCASVHDGGGSVGFHQCSRKAKVKREVDHHGKTVTLEYCGLHDPVAVQAKLEAQDAARKAKWAEQYRRDAEAALKRKLATAAVEALRQIAAGHNDPRALAAQVLVDHEAV